MPGAQSVERALLLLKVVAAGRTAGASLTEIVPQSGLEKPTARRLLLALMNAGLVEQDPETKRYFLGPESFVIGTLAADRFGIHRLALDGLMRIARISEDSAFLTVRRDTYCVCLHREEGAFPIRTQVLAPGDRHILGAGGGALAILAALDDKEVEAVIAANREAAEQRYPALAPDVLRRLVREAREQGYALNAGLIMAGSWGIGVAVRDPEGRPVAALSIAAIESRMDARRQRELARLLHEEAEKLEARLREFSMLREERTSPVLPAQAARRTAATRK